MIIIKIQNIKSDFYNTIFKYVSISMLFTIIVSLFYELILWSSLYVYIYLVVEWFNDNLMA